LYVNTITDVRFARVPFDFLCALEKGEITFDQWAVGAFLVGRVDFVRNEASYTLRALADAIGWRKCPEALRLTLAALREGHWIRFESMQGKRSPYLISLDRLHQRCYRGGVNEPTSIPYDGYDDPKDWK
jgi:hypothetical protein